MKFIFTALVFLFLNVAAFAGASDPFSLYLEVEENSPAIFAQFDKKNQKTIDRLRNEAVFENLRKDLANSIDEAKEDAKLKGVSFTQKWAYNFYRDDKNPKGVYRRVEKTTYKKLKAEDKLDQIPWVVVVDIDAFIASQKFPSNVTEPSSGSWSCDRDEETRELKRCLVGISQSGGDRNIYYEFDFSTMSWVTENSFQYEILGRSSFVWVDKDRLLVTLDGLSYHNHMNPDNPMTHEEAIASGLLSPAGYPNTVVSWKRGEELDPKKIVFKDNQAMIVAASPLKLKNKPNDQFFFFTSYYSPTKAHYSVGLKVSELVYTSHVLELPEDAQYLQFLETSKANTFRIFFGTKTTWRGFDGRDLLFADVDATDPETYKVTAPTPFFRLTEDQGIISSVTAIENEEGDESDDQIIVGTSLNVSNSAILLSQENGKWVTSRFEDPLGLEFKNMTLWEDRDDKSIHLEVSNFLTPHHEYILSSKGKGFQYELIDQGRTQFDSSKYKVEQLWVERGPDQNGVDTKVPYYIVYDPAKVQLEDNKIPAPTLIYAYGGFGVGQNPSYLGGRGAKWLDQGGVHILANIRGGDEFGPYWHTSALKGNRSNSFGDLITIAEDVIARGITSSEKLAIEGGSNGGLLTGVAVTMRPDLFNDGVW